MEFNLHLFFVVVYFIAGVASLPHHGAHQHLGSANIRRGHQHVLNAHQLNYPQANILQNVHNNPSLAWSENKPLFHQRQLPNYENSQLLNINAQNNYREIQAQRGFGLLPNHNSQLNPKVLISELKNNGEIPQNRRKHNRNIQQISLLPNRNNALSDGWWVDPIQRQNNNNFLNRQNVYNDFGKKISPSGLRADNTKILQQHSITPNLSGNNVPAEGWWNGEKLPQKLNDFAPSPGVFNERQNYGNILPGVNNVNVQSLNPLPIPLHRNVPSDGLVGSRLPQQESGNLPIDRPHNLNPAALNYPEEYVNQQQGHNQNLAYPQYQKQAPIIENSPVERQNYRNILPGVNNVNVPSLNPSPIPLHRNIPSDGLVDSRLPQQESGNLPIDSPHNLNPAALNYPEEYVDQQQGKNQNLAYPQYQTQALIIENSPVNTPNYEQEWQNPIPYQDNSVASTEGYQQWPNNEYPNLLPSESHYEPGKNSDYKNHVYPYNEVAANNPNIQVDPISFINDQVNKNNYTLTVSPLPLATNSSNILLNKPYIITYPNGTHEHIDSLDNIDIDENNVAHIKCKDGSLQHILYIVEVEYDTLEKESKNALDLPFDMGISNYSQDTKLDASNQNNIATILDYKNSNSLLDELTKPIDTQTTTEDPEILKYFKPEYILPIQPTTATSIDNFITDTKILATDTNYKPITERNIEVITQHTSQITDIPYLYESIENGNIIHEVASTSKLLQEGPTPVAYDNQQYYEPEPEPLETVQPPPQTNIPTTNKAPANDYVTDSPILVSPVLVLPNDSSKDLQNGPTPVAYDNQQYYEPEPEPLETVQPPPQTNIPTTNKVPANDYVTDSPILVSPVLVLPNDSSKDLQNEPKEKSTTPAAGPSDFSYATPRPSDVNAVVPTTCKNEKLRDDLEIDESELKIMKEPIVWFRPDEKFWDTVTKGENAFDQVSFYDIRCKPKLIEREKTIHHYYNGTEIIELVETTWDHIGDEKPKEVKSNRYVKNPDV